MTGLSGWHSSFSISISRAFTSRWTISRSKLAQGRPPRATVVLHSDWDPTALAQILRAAQTQPPIILPRPDCTSTSPPQYTLLLMMQSVCKFSRTQMTAFSTYLEKILPRAWTVVVPSPKIPLTTARSPPASTELPASTTPSMLMLPPACTVKPLRTLPWMLISPRKLMLPVEKSTSPAISRTGLT